MNLNDRIIICCYKMLHIYSILLLHLQIVKYNGFLIKIQVFTGFSAKIKVLKDFDKIKGFKGSPRGPVFANSEDPDQSLHSAVSDLGLHCLPITLLRVSQL